MGPGALKLALRPQLPAGLAAWEKRIVWRISASLLLESRPLVVPAGALVLLYAEFRPMGDWVRCEALLADGPPQSSPGLFADLGWSSASLAAAEARTSGQAVSLDLDAGGGCVAALVSAIEQAGGTWQGLNLGRLDSELRLKDLDTVNLDFWPLFDALADRELSTYDVSAKDRVAVAVSAPPGEWLDQRGAIQAQVTAAVGAPISLELPLGTSTLFRADGGAYLRLTVYRSGDGELRTSSAEHRYPE